LINCEDWRRVEFDRKTAIKEVLVRNFALRLIAGFLLIAAGIFLLLDRFGVVPSILPYIWTALFAASGVVFVFVYATDRRHWWALIPGFTLIGLSATSGGALFFADLIGEWVGALFLGGVALGFWLIFALHREQWWAGIPAGVLSTLAAVVGVGSSSLGIGAGAVFFIGLGLTFLLIYIVPPLSGRMIWPLIPAAILLLLGFVISTPYIEALNYVGAAALILGGGYLIVRALVRSPSSDDASSREQAEEE
jgi:hypothetical protein